MDAADRDARDADADVKRRGRCAAASLVILLGTLASFALPVEGVILILGVDELMDMARTAINVIGNCLATVVVAKWEGAFRNDEWRAEEAELEEVTGLGPITAVSA